MSKQKLWRITLTEEQMCVLIDAVEDWHRFISGQCEMDNATSLLDDKARRYTRDILHNKVKAVMFPELSRNQSYSWCGGQPNTQMSKEAAISYMLYREMRHRLALEENMQHYNVYQSETLTCSQQGPMIKVRPLTDNNE